MGTAPDRKAMEIPPKQNQPEQFTTDPVELQGKKQRFAPWEGAKEKTAPLVILWDTTPVILSAGTKCRSRGIWSDMANGHPGRSGDNGHPEQSPEGTESKDLVG